MRKRDKGGPFEVEVTYGKHRLAIKGRAVAYTPAKLSGPPESCHPAEGGELEDL